MPPYGIATTDVRSSRDRDRQNAPQMKRFVAIVVSILASAGCDAGTRATRHRGVPIVIADTMLRYPDGSRLVVGLRDVAFIGQLPALHAAPFVIVAGRECDDCDAPVFVIVRAPADGAVESIHDVVASHPFPGRIGDVDGATLSESRLFWGECLPQRAPTVLSFRTDFGVPGEEPLRELRITEVQGDSLIEWRMPPDPRLLAAALFQVRTRRCTEVAPRDPGAQP